MTHPASPVLADLRAGPSEAPRRTTTSPGGASRREWLLAALLMLVGGGLVGAGLAGAVRAPPPPIHIGANVWVGYEPLQFLPSTHGRPLAHVVEMRSTSAVLEGLRVGTLDGAAITIDEAIRHAGPDLPLTIVLVLDRSHGADAVVARPGVGDRPGPGARIGVETEGVGALVLSRFLERSGLEAKDVQVVDIPASGHPTAFADTGVDYLVTYEPHLRRLEAAGARRIFDSRSIPNEIVDVLAIRTPVLEARRADVDRLVADWYAGLAAMRAATGPAAERMARRLDLEPADLGAVLAALDFPDPAENRHLLEDGPMATAIDRLAAWARSGGAADGAAWVRLDRRRDGATP